MYIHLCFAAISQQCTFATKLLKGCKNVAGKQVVSRLYKRQTGRSQVLKEGEKILRKKEKKKDMRRVCIDLFEFQS